MTATPKETTAARGPRIVYKKIPVAKIKVEDRYRKDMGDIKALAEGIKTKGLLQPIVVNQQYKLMAGGRRLEAIKLLKWREVDTAIYFTNQPIEEKEIELMENVYRKDMLWHERADLERRIKEYYDKRDPNWTQKKQSELLNVSVGIVNRRLQLAEIMEEIPELRECQTADEAWSNYNRIQEALAIEALSRRAEQQNGTAPPLDMPKHEWAETHYRLGDALKLLPKLPQGSAHFGEVDPPYAIDLNERKVRGKNKVLGQDQYEEVPAENYATFLSEVAQEVYRVLYKDAFCIWWFGQEWYQVVLSSLIEAGFKVNPIPAIWTKGNTGQTASPDTMLGNSYETFFVARKGNPKMARPGRSNDFRFPPIPPARKVHKTEKPIELMLDILSTFCYPGSRIICPFLGSGVTLRAAYRKNYIGFGFDLSKQHKAGFLQKVKEDSLLGVTPELHTLSNEK